MRKQCGTVAGYNQHGRHGEQACDACRGAKREYSRAKRSGSIPKRESKASKLRSAESEGARVAKAVHDATAGGKRSDCPYPSFLKTAGRDLWDQVMNEYQLNPAAVLVLTEACRMADRLDRFAAALASESSLWFELGDPDSLDTEGVPVVVNNMIGEARQMTAAVRQALSSIGVLQQAEKKSAGTSMADEIARKRQKRLAAGKASS